MTAPRKGTHRCPRPGCDIRVPDNLFACRVHWFMLSRPVQLEIYRTAPLLILMPARIAAINAAKAEWALLEQHP